MASIKSKQGFILEHLSHEYISDSSEHTCENEEPVLSPEEVAAKIWDQWKRCRLLTGELNSCFEFKIDDLDSYEY
jgi:hypothetical protein